MKNYNTPSTELLAFAKEDVLVFSDENQTTPDNLGDMLQVQDVQDIQNI